MNIKIDHPQPSDLEDLYTHYISGNGIFPLDKRDVNAIALHAKKLLSLSAKGWGEDALRKALHSLSSSLTPEDTVLVNKVLMKLVYKGAESLGDKEKYLLETFVEKFNPDTSFIFVFDKNESVNQEITISLLVSLIK